MTTSLRLNNPRQGLLDCFCKLTFYPEGGTMKSPMLVKCFFLLTICIFHTHILDICYLWMLYFIINLIPSFLITAPPLTLFRHTPHWRTDWSWNWKYPERDAWLEKTLSQSPSHLCTPDGRTSPTPQPDPLVLLFVSLLQKILTICKGAAEVKLDLGSKISQESWHSVAPSWFGCAPYS